MFHKMRHTSFDHITLKYHKMRHMLFSYLFHQHQDQKMTTWSQLDSSYLKATPFAFGAGHVQANCGMHPKLIYDGSSLCLVPVITGHVTMWTRVQDWKHVHILTKPMATGH